jgi:hypothetical protein
MSAARDPNLGVLIVRRETGNSPPSPLFPPRRSPRRSPMRSRNLNKILTNKI